MEIRDAAARLVDLKRAFASEYSGSAHIQEVIPRETDGSFLAERAHLEKLHRFASENPIYHNRYDAVVDGIPCIAYEGDINEYWLGSIKHGSSCQPFYPTWISSAYVLARMARDLGCTELVDIGSGDGRIAYCGGILGITPYGIEIDPDLAGLQARIAEGTSQEMGPHCSDALGFDYSALGLCRPAFFIGGLPQMGGDMLATGIVGAARSLSGIEQAHVVLAGAGSRRHLSAGDRFGGWEDVIRGHDLDVVDTVTLPAVWTFDQKEDTPYVFARMG